MLAKAHIDPAMRLLARMVDQVHAARAERSSLDIRGGGSKSFYGEARSGRPFDMTQYAGIESYEPSELVVTVRAGTPLAELEAALAERGQCLAFEPPHFGPEATVGGMVATGLAGPARATAGGVRDFVLGATLLSGRAELLSFGGQVMKNVAGFDVSRALVGAMGIFGAVLSVSVRVSPVAAATATLRFEMSQEASLDRLNAWAGMPLPITGSAWVDGELYLRLGGARAAVAAAIQALGGECLCADTAQALWQALREHGHAFFANVRAAIACGTGVRLWRLGLPQVAPVLPLPGEQLVEWGGAQRWLSTSASPVLIRETAERLGGHATLFIGRDGFVPRFHPLSPPIERIHRNLKRAFDPDRVFNTGRLYPTL